MITTYSKFAASKIVKKYGYTPADKRRARMMMQRRGVSWKGAREAVNLVNAGMAHANFAFCRELDAIAAQAS